MKKILIIDDEAVIADLYKRTLSSLSGIEVNIEEPVKDLVEGYDYKKYDLLIIDKRLGCYDALEYTRQIIDKYGHLKIIVISGSVSEDYSSRVDEFGLFAFELKPISMSRLRNLVSSALEL